MMYSQRRVTEPKQGRKKQLIRRAYNCICVYCL